MLDYDVAITAARLLSLEDLRSLRDYCQTLIEEKEADANAPADLAGINPDDLFEQNPTS